MSGDNPMKDYQPNLSHNNNNVALQQQQQQLHRRRLLGAEAKDNPSPLHDSISNDEEDGEDEGNNEDQDDIESVKGVPLTGDEMEPASKNKFPPLKNAHVAQIKHACHKVNKSSKRNNELAAQDEETALATTRKDRKTLRTDATMSRQTTFKALVIGDKELAAQQIAQQESLKGVPATNDNCENVLEGATYKLQQFGRIGIPHLDKIDITGALGSELDVVGSLGCVWGGGHDS